MSEKGCLAPVMIAEEYVARLGAVPADASEKAHIEQARAATKNKDNYMASGDLAVLVNGKTATLEIAGTIVPRRNFWTFIGFDTAAEDIEALPEVLPKNINKVNILYDTPGGFVQGIDEAASALYSLRERAVTTAYTRGMMTSAGYYLGSQQDYVYMSPTAITGSVGVKMVHFDLSKQLNMLGVNVTQFVSPERKGEGTSYKPLSEETKKEYANKGCQTTQAV